MWHPLTILAAIPTHAATALPVPIPRSTAWVPTLLLAIVWLLAAAAIVGPLLRWLKLPRRSAQLFADDLAQPKRP